MSTGPSNNAPAFADFSPLWRWLDQREQFGPLRTALSAAVDDCRWNHGNLPQWQRVIEILQSQPPVAEQTSALRDLMPWRKGPLQLGQIQIDTEWRSDWKWQRIEQGLADGQIGPLHRNLVLDVGSGNGYFGWQMRAAGADCVIGIDPSLLFVAQFFAARQFLNDDCNWVLPLGIEHMPQLALFDSVFSMGVLYHRRSPIGHLEQLHKLLKPGGQLVLETLVVDGDAGAVLTPSGRYAQMRNVWFIPSVAALQIWLQRCRFMNIEVVDVSATTTAEQRTTQWMRNRSLADFLDPDDHRRTIEGYPAPIRATICAKKTT